MRISDWSSDVCASDLRTELCPDREHRPRLVAARCGRPAMVVHDRAARAYPPTGLARSRLRCDRRHGGGACLFPAAIRLILEPYLERYHTHPGSGTYLPHPKLTSFPPSNFTLTRSSPAH